MASAEAPARPSPATDGPDQLDGRGPGQHPMAGAPDFSHSPFTQLLLQAIAPQLPRPPDLGAQPVDHPGADVGHGHHEQIGKHQPKEELRRVHPERSAAGRDRESDDDRDRADRRQGGQHRPARRGRHHHGEEHHPHGDPGESQKPLWYLESHRVAEFGGGDGVAAGDLEHQPRFMDGGKREALAPDHGGDHQRHHDPDHAGDPTEGSSPGSGLAPPG